MVLGEFHCSNGATLKINFKDFTAKELSTGGCSTSRTYTLRRLCTPSTGDKGNKWPVSMATTWLWYWRNQNGVWNEFGLEVGKI
jgi:hypothetical protein